MDKIQLRISRLAEWDHDQAGYEKDIRPFWAPVMRVRAQFWDDMLCDRDPIESLAKAKAAVRKIVEEWNAQQAGRMFPQIQDVEKIEAVMDHAYRLFEIILEGGGQ